MTEGRAELVFAREAGAATYLRRQFANYPFHICRPHTYADDPAGMVTLYLQSLSGGIYQDERLKVNLTAEAETGAHVTTQAATVVRGMESGSAGLDVTIEAGPESFVEYLPDAGILFPGACLSSRVQVCAHETATVIVGDSFLDHDPKDQRRPFGWYRGELQFAFQGDEPCVRDRFTVTGAAFRDGASGINGAYPTQGTLYVFHRGDATETLIESMRSALEIDGVYAGASLLPGSAGIWARILASDGATLKSAMGAAWSAAREGLCGRRPAPRRK